MKVFHTIGHSTRTLSEFTALLREAGVDLVVDVRTVPRSRKNPQFNRETLHGELASAGIGYVHIPELGGLRGRRKHDAPSPNTFWENDSFRNYADYALTPPFRAGLGRLRQLGRERAPAIMCAEAVWWRCHRRIITDYLIGAGETVFHIMGPSAIEPATINPAATRSSGDGLIYVTRAGRTSAGVEAPG